MNQKGFAPIIVLLLVVVAGGVLIGVSKTKSSSHLSSEIASSDISSPQPYISPSPIPSLSPN